VLPATSASINMDVVTLLQLLLLYQLPSAAFHPSWIQHCNCSYHCHLAVAQGEATGIKCCPAGCGLAKDEGKI